MHPRNHETRRRSEQRDIGSPALRERDHSADSASSTEPSQCTSGTARMLGSRCPPPIPLAAYGKTKTAHALHVGFGRHLTHPNYGLNKCPLKVRLTPAGA